ncbi:hypothetical protein NLG97_g11064 [Lecanicillium saksenae]|uniref:Uncharacterized protein n=1 Tax=Lecanicillium saksenae TaxID=468837 RepID=A0ACC1QD86_9HYPO|nr:hypothetical protein NLG97_g11064 [Lecanicillium saksenae]
MLEKREADAFGLMPDPARATYFGASSFLSNFAEEAERLGWDNERMGPLRGPSSSWVVAELHPTWTGPGSEQRQSFGNFLNRHRRQAEWLARLAAECERKRAEEAREDQS